MSTQACVKLTESLAACPPAPVVPVKSFGIGLAPALSLDLAGQAAQFVEAILVKSLGGAAEAFIALNHDMIAKFTSPDLAAFAAKISDEFAVPPAGR
jgi:hypothetical protein